MAVIPAIPASQIVSVTPSVLSAGGTGLAMVGVLLTQNTRAPSGLILSFPSAAAINAYFGSLSNEAALGTIYFLGNDNSQLKPGNLYITQYNTASISAYLRGGALGLTLTQLQALSGNLSVTIDGVTHNGSVNFGTVTSFSNGAQLMATNLGLGTASVYYDSIATAFTIQSLTTGTISAITYSSGTASLSAPLKLTQATGGVISPGAAANTPGTGAPVAFMNNLITQTLNWVTFTTTWEPTDADKISFSTWTTGQNNRFLYAMWETSVLDTQAGGPSVPVSTITAGNFSGTAMLYSNPAVDTLGGEIAAFLLGQIASINFNALNGRTTSAFRSQTGLLPQVTSGTISSFLLSYSMNFYGQYTTSSSQFTFLYPGSISGPFLWIDSYINQVWFNSQLQQSEMTLLANARSIPYNTNGYGLIEAALLGPVQAALNFGGIVPGIVLTPSQVSQINGAAGIQIDQILSTRGWYIQVVPAPATVRQARQSPVINIWYTDGESIQQINLNSIDIL